MTGKNGGYVTLEQYLSGGCLETFVRPDPRTVQNQYDKEERHGRRQPAAASKPAGTVSYPLKLALPGCFQYGGTSPHPVRATEPTK